jgi:hypothetical protein
VRTTSDPPRYRAAGSGASETARALLEVSRAEAPSAEQIARLARRLPLGGPPSGGHAPPRAGRPLVPQPPPAPAASILPSALLGASLAVAVLGGVWWREAAIDAARPSLSSAPAASAVPAPEPAPGVVAATITDSALPSQPHRAPGPSSPPSTAASGRAIALDEAPEEASAPTAPTGSIGGSEGLVRSDPETEIQLLQRAQQLLPHAPASALAAAEEHLRRFRGGALSQEREVIAISALVALGRKEEARLRAARFVESYPRSAHRPGLEALDRGAGELAPTGERGGRAPP